MHKLNVFIVAALIAGAAVLGTTAALRTTALGGAQKQSSDRAVALRTKQLDRFEASLRAQLRKQPPKLQSAPTAAAPAPAPVAPRVVYRRPPAIVVVRHTQHGEDGEHGDREAEGGGDD